MISNETSSWWQWQSDYKPEKRTSVLTVAPDLEGVILKYFQELKTWDILGIVPIWGLGGPQKYSVGYWWIRTAPGGTHRVTNRQSHWPDLQRLQPASALNMHFFLSPSGHHCFPLPPSLLSVQQVPEIKLYAQDKVPSQQPTLVYKVLNATSTANSFRHFSKAHDGLKLV